MNEARFNLLIEQEAHRAMLRKLVAENAVVETYVDDAGMVEVVRWRDRTPAQRGTSRCGYCGSVRVGVKCECCGAHA